MVRFDLGEVFTLSLVFAAFILLGDYRCLSGLFLPSLCILAQNRIASPMEKADFRVVVFREPDSANALLGTGKLVVMEGKH